MKLHCLRLLLSRSGVSGQASRPFNIHLNAFQLVESNTRSEENALHILQYLLAGRAVDNLHRTGLRFQSVNQDVTVIASLLRLVSSPM